MERNRSRDIENLLLNYKFKPITSKNSPITRLKTLRSASKPALSSRTDSGAIQTIRVSFKLVKDHTRCQYGISTPEKMVTKSFDSRPLSRQSKVTPLKTPVRKRLENWKISPIEKTATKSPELQKTELKIRINEFKKKIDEISETNYKNLDVKMQKQEEKLDKVKESFGKLYEIVHKKLLYENNTKK